MFSILIGTSHSWWFLPVCLYGCHFIAEEYAERAFHINSHRQHRVPWIAWWVTFIFISFLFLWTFYYVALYAVCVCVYFKLESRNYNATEWWLKWEEETKDMNTKRRRWMRKEVKRVSDTDERCGLKQVIISAKGNSIKQQILSQSYLNTVLYMHVWRCPFFQIQSKQTSDGLTAYNIAFKVIYTTKITRQQHANKQNTKNPLLRFEAMTI